MTHFPTDPMSRGAEPPSPAPASFTAPQPAGQSADVPWYLDPRELLYTLRLRRIWVALPLVLMLAGALAALLLIPAQYAATTEILVDPHGVQVVKDDLNPPDQTSDASLLLVDSEMLVLTSDEVLRQVVDKFGLDRDPEFEGRTSLLSLMAAAARRLAGVSGPPEDPKLVALRSLRERSSVHRVERSFVLSLSVTTDSREKSARIAQGIADAYLGTEAASRAEVARRASAAISARLGELQAAVREAEDRAQAFKTANNLVGTRLQLVSEQQLGQINEQLGAARARADEQLARLNQIEAVLKGGGSLNSLPEVLQSPTIGLLRSQLAQAERILADNAISLGSRHPTLIAAQTQVRTVRAQLDAEMRRIASGVRNEYRTAAANVAALTKTLESGKSEAVSVGDAQVKLRELERQIDARRSVYEAFLVRARQLGEQQQVGNSATRIISPASPPAHRQGPPAAAILAAALVAGLGLGIGTALIAERVSGRIRTSRRLRQRSGLPVLGALPPPPGALAAPGTIKDPASDSRYDLAVLRLRDHLGRPPGGSRSRSVVVTAADRVSGKSRVALELAAAMAAEHDRVFLVDADPEGDMVEDFKLSLALVPARPQDSLAVLNERRVLHVPGLRFATVDRQAATCDPKIVADLIYRRLDDFDAVIVNAGVVGSDLFTDRLVNDPRPSVVLLAASAAKSTFASIERALPSTDRSGAVAAVLTDASSMDA